MPVVKFDDEVTYFIFESGGIYCDVGLIAETPEVLWNECYSADYGIALPWDKIGTGEQRKRYVRKSLREYLWFMNNFKWTVKFELSFASVVENS